MELRSWPTHDLEDLIGRDADSAGGSIVHGAVFLTWMLDALVERLRRPRPKAARGPRQKKAVDELLIELQNCYEASGGRVAFGKNDVGRHVSGPYPDFLRAVRRHIFPGRSLSENDEALIERARKLASKQRRDQLEAAKWAALEGSLDSTMDPEIGVLLGEQ
jgi:hypothetical protein